MSVDSIPADIIATYLVRYKTDNFPPDIDLDTALDMVRTDLMDIYPSTDYESWYLSDGEGKPFGAAKKK